MPRFQIITDTHVHTEGETNPLFKPLGHEQAVLKSYAYQGDWIELRYTNDLTFSIPEARIQGIANIPA